jgi:MFS family permease
MDRFDIDNFQYNLFYSVYSLPNIILPLFGGYFLDKIGIRLGLVLIMSTITIG